MACHTSGACALAFTLLLLLASGCAQRAEIETSPEFDLTALIGATLRETEAHAEHVTGNVDQRSANYDRVALWIVTAGPWVLLIVFVGLTAPRIVLRILRLMGQVMLRRDAGRKAP